MAQLSYSVVNQWASGFQGSIGLKADTLPLSGWTITFAAPFDITSIWGAEIVSYVNGVYTLRNLAWNSAIPVGGTVNFGFVANGPSTVSGLQLGGTPATPPAPPLPTASIADVQAIEGDTGSLDLLFTVSLSTAATAPVRLSWTTADGTARAGEDYTAASGILQFAAGETVKTIRVAVLGDRRSEASESFALTLSAPSGATLGRAQAVGTILDNDAAPSLSVSDVSVTEGDSGTASAVFTVRLDQASGQPVTVTWTTADGTARAGEDYTAASGSLTFAAGETSKTVAVAVLGDRAVEADESFRLLLSNPANARLGDGEGVATIRNDDATPVVLPSLSIADASVAEGDGGAAAAPGYFSTSGNQIVDAAGHAVRIAAVSWFGMETETFAPHGLWTRNWQQMMGEIKAQGFNTIRLPFSTDAVHATSISGVDFALNPDLRGLTALQVMDKVVGEAGKLGLRVILDHHTVGAGRQVGENGFWYDAAHSETGWVNDWQALAARYANNPTVIGADLHNEPWGATWSDWDRAAERAGNAIQAVNPNLLIIVEGVSQANGDNYWWGGNLQGVRDNPVTLNVPGKVVYSPHDYPNSIYPQSWFQTPNFGDTLYKTFDKNWGYIFRENIGPIWLGEFGSRLSDPKDLVWLDKITKYLNGDLDTNGTNDLAAGQLGQSWSWWSWNPNSTDTGGILQDDWRTVITAKVDALKPMMFTFPSVGTEAPTAANLLSFAVTLSAPAAGPVSVDWRTAPGTASAADFTAASGTLSFAAGERTKVVAISVTGDRTAEADETMVLELLNASGATLQRVSATGTIRNDDGPAAPPPAPTPTPTPTPSGGLSGSIRVTQDWGTGYVAEVTLRNAGPALSNWHFDILTADTVTNLWEGTILGQSSNGYHVANAAWNGSLATGASVTLGFQATGHHLPSQGDLFFH